MHHPLVRHVVAKSGEILCFLAEPGNLPFKRVMRRHYMQWMVAEVA